MESNKKKGRPKGTRNGEGRGVRWQPKEWKPVYETIVALHCMGYKNKDISLKLKSDFAVRYTPMAISLILKTKQAVAIIELFKARVKTDTENKAKDRITALTERAMSNLESVIGNDKLLEDSPFAIFNASAKFLEGIGKLDGNKPKVSVGVVIAGNVGDAMAASIAKADRVKNY
jgi:hypothetical protein